LLIKTALNHKHTLYSWTLDLIIVKTVTFIRNRVVTASAFRDVINASFERAM